MSLFAFNSNAQWNLTGPTSTNSDVNIGGMQEARFHIKKPGGLSSIEMIGTNPFKQLLYLTKEVGNISFPRGNFVINSLPSWGMDINATDKRLSFNYTDFFGQPTITTNPLTGMTQTTWPTPAEIFSMNINAVTSQVNLNLNRNLFFNGLNGGVIFSTGALSINGNSLLSIYSRDGMVISKAQGGNGNLTVEGDSKVKDIVVEGEFKVKDINGDNQFAIDNGGNVRAREVKVDYSLIPDYVFKEGYKLMSLTELESFIKANKHLPNIKGENEYTHEEGLSLGEMNTKLLEKVEELTLYTIQQQKEIEELKKAVNSLLKK